jgi:hypothetical protein
MKARLWWESRWFGSFVYFEARSVDLVEKHDAQLLSARLHKADRIPNKTCGIDF